MTFLAHIADRVANRPLLIMPQKLAVIASVMDGRIGIDSAGLAGKAGPMPASSRQATNSNSNPFFTRRGAGVAVIAIVGSLVHRSSFIDAISGLTSYESIRSAVNVALNDDDVTSIVLDIDSPGGEAVGAFEVADYIRIAARKKPIGAAISGLCCSAAFAIASATKRIVISKTSMAGSIGVVFLHLDRSRQHEIAGVRPTFIFAGKHKVDGNSLQEMSEEVKAEIQREIDFFYDLFVETVVAGRPRMTPDDVRATEAKTYIGAEAVRIGLADDVATIGDLIQEFSTFDKKVRQQKLGKYELTAKLYGSATAIQQQVRDAHIAGVRAGMAAAMSAE